MVKKITDIKIIGLYLNDYGRKCYLRELASLLGKPHQTIKPYAEHLVKSGILVKNKRKSITEYWLNLKDKRIYDYLEIAEKDKLMERLNEDTLIRVLFEKLSDFFAVNTFILFGSAVDKTQKGSDYDMLVIGGKNLLKELAAFEKIYNKKVHKIQIKKIENATPALIREIYKKHLIFNNTESVIRFFGESYGQNKLV